LSDASNDVRGPYVLDPIIVEATRLQGVQEPFFSPIDLLAGFFAGAVVAGMIRGAATSGTTALVARVELNIGAHTAERMAQRGITEAMVKTALDKGTPFFDPKHGTINYVLKEGFASGKDLLVGRNPFTGKITTVIRGTDLVSRRLVP